MCWLTSPVAWATHIPTDAMAQLTYSVVCNTVTDFPKRKLPSSFSLTSHSPRHYFTTVCINFLYHYCVTQQTWNVYVYDVSIVCVVHSILWDSMWFDMEIVVKFCKLIIFASKLGTSKMFLQSNAQSLQILLIPIT